MGTIDRETTVTSISSDSRRPDFEILTVVCTEGPAPLTQRLEVPLRSGLNALYGRNGAGKTRLLKAIRETISGERAGAILVPENASASVEVYDQHAALKLAVVDRDGGSAAGSTCGALRYTPDPRPAQRRRHAACLRARRSWALRHQPRRDRGNPALIERDCANEGAHTPRGSQQVPVR